MCINCNIPLPVALNIIAEYGLPLNSIMSNRQLANIINPRVPGGGLKALMSGDVSDSAFDPSYETYNYETIHLYDWVLEENVETKHGNIKTGRIIPRSIEYIPDKPNPGEELDRIYSHMKY